MTGGALPSPSRRRRLLWTFVIALNVPLLVHLVFPGWVGLTQETGAAAAVRERAPMHAYLSGQVGAPEGFPYQPILRRTSAGARMVDPRGRCGSALGDTGRSFDFAAACDSHDYGYDLLRFFAMGGAERRSVDTMFGEALWDSCRGRSFVTRFNCYGWAATFDWVNRFNSLWRRYEMPRGRIGDNTVSDWSTKAVQVVLIADAGLAVSMLRRRRRTQSARLDPAAMPQPALAAGGR